LKNGVKMKKISTGMIAISVSLSSVHAQDISSVRTIEEVVVTAQKRTERLLDVPMSITAISGAQLTESGVSSTGDLAQLVPGLTTTSNGLGFTPAIRGVSSSGPAPGDETNVSIYLDDVYIGSPLAGLFELRDIERIEVLKGPQGTLFGRNATGGAIRIVTRAPSFSPIAEVSADYGFEFDSKKLGAYLSGPVTERMSASLSVNSEEDNGYVKGISTSLKDRKVSRADNFGVRSKLLYEPTSDISLTFSGDYSEKSDDRMFNLNPRGGRNINENNQDYLSAAPFELAHSVVPIVDVDTWGASLHTAWNVSEKVELKSITAYREMEGLYQVDTDRSSVSVSSLVINQTQDTFSQELVVTGEYNTKLDWLAGVYYYSSVSEAPRFESYRGDVPFGPMVFSLKSKVDTSSYSGFGELNYKLAEKINFIFGLRYTDETKKFQYLDSFARSNDDRKSWDSTTFRIVARYDFSEFSNAYLSRSTGFKSGVYNAYSLSPTDPVDPEEIEAWELGAKANIAGVTLTAAIFVYDYTDLQVQAHSILADGSPVSSLKNAAEASIKGFELGISSHLTDSLSFNIGYSGLPEAKYNSFPAAQVSVFNPNTGGADSIAPFDATGSRLVKAPKHQLSSQLFYDASLLGGAIRASITYSYNDGFFWQPGDLIPEDSYAVFNARLAWTTPDEKYTFTVWGENLTDERYSIYTATTAPGVSDVYAKPLEFGVGVSARF